MSRAEGRTAFGSAHTNRTAVVAYEQRLTPELLGVETQCRAIWRTIKDDAGLMTRITASPLKWVVYRLQRNDHRSDPLELLAQLIVGLANLGVPESFFRRITLFLTGVTDDCFAGSATASLDELDRQELLAEQHENTANLERRIDGATPDELEAEAAAIEAEIAVEMVRARVLRRRARQQRAGLSPAACS